MTRRPRRGRGRLIAVEGLDGVGKTTLSRELAVALGATWTTTPGPDLRAVRELVEASFAGAPRARALFYASTVLAVSERVEARLGSGRDLVVDRYWLSTWAYAQLLDTPPPLVSIEALLRPADVTLFLDADDDVRRRRLEARGMSALDRVSTTSDAAGRLRKAYGAGLSRPIAGRVVGVDTTRTSVGACLASALRSCVAEPSWLMVKGAPGARRSGS